MITYKMGDRIDSEIVYLAGKRVGQINRSEADMAYRYSPDGSTFAGEGFPSLEQCRRSLEDDTK